MLFIFVEMYLVNANCLIFKKNDNFVKVSDYLLTFLLKKLMKYQLTFLLINYVFLFKFSLTLIIEEHFHLPLILISKKLKIKKS